MADVAETKPVEPVVEEKVEKTETATTGANGEVTETITEKVAEAPAEKSDEKVAAEKNDEKDAAEKPAEKETTDEKNGADAKSDRRENNDRKRRGSFNGERRGRGDYNNKRGRGSYSSRPSNNNKSSFADLPESSDADEIRRQVDFYFSDSNLPTDKFLMGLTGGHENNPVPLKTIHDFKRMRHFQPFSAVRDAVASSKFLTLSDNDQITRKNPLPDKYTSDLRQNRNLMMSATQARSVYVKGFGDEKPSTQLDIEAFFEPYGPINSIRLRRVEGDNTFKGSVFVEFENEDLQKQFLELDPKPTYEDRELKIMTKAEYIDTKNEDIRDGKVKPRSPNGYRNGGGRSFDRDDWKGRRDYDQRNDRGRGRGRGGRGRGGDRGGRGGGRYQRRDRSQSGSPHDRFGRTRKNDKDDVPSRAEAEAGREKTDGEGKADAPAQAGAEGGESKKRAREDDGEGEKGEAKKAKEEVAATES